MSLSGDLGTAGPARSGPGRRSGVHNVRVSSARTARAAASLLIAASLVCLVLAVWFDLHTDPHGPGVDYATGRGSMYVLIGVVQTAMALLILRRDRQQGFGWGLIGAGFFWATDGLSQSYAEFGIRADHALPGVTLAVWSLMRLGSFLPLTVALQLYLFPTGRFLPGRWRVVGWVGVCAMVLSSLVVLVTPMTTPEGVHLPPDVDPNAGALPLPESVGAVMQAFTGALTVLGFVLSMVSVVVRYRRSRDLERDRMRWLLWSVVVVALLIVVPPLLEISYGDAFIFVVALVPSIGMTIAILDPGLVSIEELLGRTVVYAALAVVILLADLLVLAVLTNVLGDSLSQRQVVLVVLLVSVLLYGPLRQRLVRGVQRVMLGARTDPFDVVAGLGSTLESTEEGPEQLAAVAGAVADAFRVRYVAIEVDRGSGERLIATHGVTPEQTRSVPIVYRGADVGRIVLPARGLRSRLSRRDDQAALARIAELLRITDDAAQAVYNLQLRRLRIGDRDLLTVEIEEQEQHLRDLT